MKNTKRPKIINTCSKCQSVNVLSNKSGEKFCRRCGHSWFMKLNISINKDIQKREGKNVIP